MNRWFIFNIFILGFAMFKVLSRPSNIAILFGLIALLLILFNWTRHAVFTTIRQSKDRKEKIKFAKLSKRILPFHKWIGTTALIIALLHASFMLYKYGLYLQNKKILSGILALTVLSALVLSGWIRWYKTTPAKRYVHWGLGYTIFFLVILHLYF